MTFTQSQQKAIDVALSGQSISIDGKAGSGKTFITKHIIEQLQAKNKNVVVLAPTGIAAINAGGQTIHSFFGVNPFGVASFKECRMLKSEKRRLIDKVSTIIIDEKSMVRCDLLDAINWTMLKNGCGSLSKKQVILVGDMGQLQPVAKDNTKSVLYETYNGVEYYHAKIYSQLEITTVELTEIIRQKDPDFIEALNIVREGGKASYFRQFIGKGEMGIILCPTNSIVDEYNKIGLQKCKGEIYTFTATIEGNVKFEDFNLPSKIEVKNGCKIMYLVNSDNKTLANGTLGIFISHANCHYIRVGEIDYPLDKVRITKKEYVLNENQNKLELKEIGSITQYPFRLAFAITIHKSQGLTFDEATIDFRTPCFAPGQSYVAFSRVKTPQGLSIII
jgi:ATP-dependent exoDNAse (exonuclease V) alpha subunit